MVSNAASVPHPDDVRPAGCPKDFEFGALPCVREEGHPGPHFTRWAGERIWFNDKGQRVEGGSAEDYA